MRTGSRSWTLAWAIAATVLLARAVEARPALRGHVTAFDPKPGQAYVVTVRGTVPVRR